MNIEEYRAMKAEEEKLAQNPPEPEPEQVPDAPLSPPETTQDAPTVDEPIVQKIKIGDEEFEPTQIEEFKKGYLRQEEYLQRVQELKQKELEIEYALKLAEELKNDPEAYQRIAQRAPQLSPEAVRMQQLQQELEDLKVQREVDRLSAKYTDFDVQKVAKVIEEKGITNIEDAYLLSVSKTAKEPTVDIEALKAQIEADLLKKLQAESVSPSLIASNGSPSVPQVEEVPISPEEQKVARMMGLSDKDYIKWRDK